MKFFNNKGKISRKFIADLLCKKLKKIALALQKSVHI